MPSKSPSGKSCGQRHRERRQARRRAHCGEVAQIDGERAMADRSGRREAAIEVDAVDDRIGGDDFERVARRLVDRRIVADVDEQPVGRRAQARRGSARSWRARPRPPRCDFGAAGRVLALVRWHLPLLGIVDGAGLANHRDLDLAGVLELALDAARDVARQPHGLVVADLLAFDHDADLAAGLQRERLRHALERVGDVLEASRAA